MNARKEDVDDYVTLNELLVNYWTRVSQDEATLEDIVAEYKSRPEEGVVREGRGSSDVGGRGAARIIATSTSYEEASQDKRWKAPSIRKYLITESGALGLSPAQIKKAKLKRNPADANFT